jgi:hypothetical protein
MDSNKEQLLLLQILCNFHPTWLAASVSLQVSKRHDVGLWPIPNFLPVVLANVDMKMPSSAYRKLLEAFACWQCMPTFDNVVVVDLGESPGGWTFAVLLHCEPRKIIAVDRAKLDPRLMNHSQVEFVQPGRRLYLSTVATSRLLDDERYHCLPRNESWSYWKLGARIDWRLVWWWLSSFKATRHRGKR